MWWLPSFVFKFLRVGAYRRGGHAHRRAYTDTNTHRPICTQTQYVQEVWRVADHSEKFNLCVIRVPEGKKRENGSESEFDEILTEHFLKVKKDIM